MKQTDQCEKCGLPTVDPWGHWMIIDGNRYCGACGHAELAKAGAVAVAVPMPMGTSGYCAKVKITEESESDEEKPDV